MRKFLFTLLLMVVAISPSAQAASIRPYGEIYTGNIAATFVTDTLVIGSISGDLSGVVTTDLENGVSAFITKNGAIGTVDYINLRPFGQDMAIWYGMHLIAEGTGDYDGAGGLFLTYGIVNTQTGEVSLTYWGYIF